MSAHRPSVNSKTKPKSTMEEFEGYDDSYIMKSVKARVDQFCSELEECGKDRENLFEKLSNLGEKLTKVIAENIKMEKKICDLEKKDKEREDKFAELRELVKETVDRTSVEMQEIKENTGAEMIRGSQGRNKMVETRPAVICPNKHCDSS